MLRSADHVSLKIRVNWPLIIFKDKIIAGILRCTSIYKLLNLGIFYIT